VHELLPLELANYTFCISKAKERRTMTEIEDLQADINLLAGQVGRLLTIVEKMHEKIERTESALLGPKSWSATTKTYIPPTDAITDAHVTPVVTDSQHYRRVWETHKKLNGVTIPHKRLHSASPGIDWESNTKSDLEDQYPTSLPQSSRSFSSPSTLLDDLPSLDIDQGWYVASDPLPTGSEETLSDGSGTVIRRVDVYKSF